MIIFPTLNPSQNPSLSDWLVARVGLAPYIQVKLMSPRSFKNCMSFVRFNEYVVM